MLCFDALIASFRQASRLSFVELGPNAVDSGSGRVCWWEGKGKGGRIVRSLAGGVGIGVSLLLADLVFLFSLFSFAFLLFPVWDYCRGLISIVVEKEDAAL